MKDQVDQQEPAEIVTPGNMLKQARLKQQLTIEQVALKLNLRVHNIQALEEDDYDNRLSATFTKGYLRAYAKLLKLSESDVLSGFEQVNQASKEPAKLQSFSKRVAKQTSDDRLMLLTYVIFAVLIALSLMWWLQQPAQDKDKPVPNAVTTALSGDAAAIDQNKQQPADDTDQSADDSQTQSSQDSAAAPPADKSVATNAAQATDSGTKTTESVPVTQTTAAADSVGDSAEQPQPKPSFPASTRVDLVFHFDNDCWINIVDATGEAIAYGTKVAGRTMPVNGVPPFQITLGAPAGVTISYAGKPVDLSRFPATKTAKFTLPLQD